MSITGLGVDSGSGAGTRPPKPVSTTGLEGAVTGLRLGVTLLLATMGLGVEFGLGLATILRLGAGVPLL